VSANENPAVAGGVSEVQSCPIAPEDSPRPARTQAARRTVTATERREYLLSELRLAVSLTEVEKNHLTTLGVAFKAGMLTEEWILAELRQSPFFRPLVDGGIG
jgi:hypothetical protein